MTPNDKGKGEVPTRYPINDTVVSHFGFCADQTDVITVEGCEVDFVDFCTIVLCCWGVLS